jgi:hypothetical protein
MRKCMSRRDILCVEKNRNRHERPVGTHCALCPLLILPAWSTKCSHGTYALMHFDLPTGRPPRADDKFVTILLILK